MVLQIAFDSKDRTEHNSQKFQNLALLQIVLPDSSHLSLAKKIIDGINPPGTPYMPFHVILNLEPIPAGYAMVTCMVSFYC